MTLRFRRTTIAALLVVGAACAARSGPSSAPADLATAEQLVAAGCYRCLVHALALYETMLTKQGRPSPAVQQAATETAALLVLRERELGVPGTNTLDTLRRLSTTPALPGHLPWPVIAALVDLAPGDVASADPDVSAARNTRERRNELADLRAQLKTIAVPSLLERYLAVTFDCNDAEARRTMNGNELLASVRDTPTLHYRVAACGFGPPGTFAAIRAADPRWGEVAFYEGRAAATSRRPDLRGAIALLAQAREAVPDSAATILALAHAQRGYGDLEPALASYDAAIALVPRNREALLGRAITLSYLERHPEVVETTSTMIDYGTWLMGDAYYWRARSRYVLKALDDAWSDAEHAVTLAPNTNVYTLAGVIAYDRKELDVARDRFHRAREADVTNCTAHSYFALVNAAQNNWPVATPVFSQAMSCFVQAAAEAQTQLEEIEASDFDEVYKARLARQQRTTIEESNLKAAQAAYNAAQGLLREGRRDAAMAHLKVALDHPEVNAQALALQKLIAP